MSLGRKGNFEEVSFEFRMKRRILPEGRIYTIYTIIAGSEIIIIIMNFYSPVSNIVSFDRA